MWSILRWWSNPNKENRNRIFSRSLGKIAFVDNNFTGVRPDQNEFWLSDITFEINPGKSSGCFLCEPFKKLNWEELIPLNRSMCTLTNYNKCSSTLILTPINFQEEDLVPWILPFSFRGEILKSVATCISSIIVNLGGNQEWKTSNSPKS